MLSPEDNETVTRVGPGTPMGQLMRQYWIPFLSSSDVARDGQPYRVRLLGEDLVAYRDSNGTVGLVEAYCPHRGARLSRGEVLGDNISCRYHGVTLDGSGTIVRVPAMPGCAQLEW